MQIIHTQAEDTDLKLEDIKQQTLTEIKFVCSQCDPSSLSITEGVFRCFPGSESAVTYRALLHETYQISSLELEVILARWVSSGRAIVVQSLVLQAQQSCPIVVADANDAECRISSPTSRETEETGSASNSVAVIIGGTSGAVLGVVLIVGLMIIVLVVTIVKQKQSMVRLKYETRYAQSDVLLAQYYSMITNRVTVVFYSGILET